jgi:hypothetical protein
MAFTQHAARSTQHAARSTQHAARSTQHAARSTQHAGPYSGSRHDGAFALAPLILFACASPPEDETNAAKQAGLTREPEGVTLPASTPTSDLRGAVEPLFWKARVHHEASPTCEKAEDCLLRLPIGLPAACGPHPRPYTGRVQTRVLLAGCGFVGARFTDHGDKGKGGSSRELWYSLDSGALVGRGAMDAENKVETWGEGPAGDCKLSTCDPCRIEQKDPGTPTAHGLFGPRMWCDLPNVGVDSSHPGQWFREPPPPERLQPRGGEDPNATVEDVGRGTPGQASALDGGAQ